MFYIPWATTSFLPSFAAFCVYLWRRCTCAQLRKLSSLREQNFNVSISTFLYLPFFLFFFFLSSWNYSGQTLLSDSASFVSIVGGAQKLVSIAIRERIFSLLLRSLRIGRCLSFVICVKIFSPSIFFFFKFVDDLWCSIDLKIIRLNM